MNPIQYDKMDPFQLDKIRIGGIVTFISPTCSHRANALFLCILINPSYFYYTSQSKIVYLINILL